MYLKTFQKKAIKQSAPQSGLKQPRPFIQPNPNAQHAAAPSPGAAERAARYGHDFAHADARPRASVPERKGRNVTGLPDRLKAGVERLSGLSLDDVRVRYNSPEPARYDAHAHTRGTEIHLGAGQERHLAHEAWHVVQQKQGRVRPTARSAEGGAAVNEEEGLEREADLMGARADGGVQAAGEGARPDPKITAGANSASDRAIQFMRRVRLPDGRTIPVWDNHKLTHGQEFVDDPPQPQVQQGVLPQVQQPAQDERHDSSDGERGSVVKAAESYQDDDEGQNLEPEPDQDSDEEQDLPAPDRAEQLAESYVEGNKPRRKPSAPGRREPVERYKNRRSRHKEQWAADTYVRSHSGETEDPEPGAAMDEHWRGFRDTGRRDRVGEGARYSAPSIGPRTAVTGLPQEIGREVLGNIMSGKPPLRPEKGKHGKVSFATVTHHGREKLPAARTPGAMIRKMP